MQLLKYYSFLIPLPDHRSEERDLVGGKRNLEILKK